MDVFQGISLEVPTLESLGVTKTAVFSTKGPLLEISVRNGRSVKKTQDHNRNNSVFSWIFVYFPYLSIARFVGK
jgi:hypothetical protein